MQDYLVFGNAYLEKRTNHFGEVITLEPALAKYTRRGLDLDTYWFVQYGMTTQPYQFTKGCIFHLMDAEWTITTLTHTVSPDNGFTTSLELEVRIGDLDME